MFELLTLGIVIGKAAAALAGCTWALIVVMVAAVAMVAYVWMVGRLLYTSLYGPTNTVSFPPGSNSTIYVRTGIAAALLTWSW
jgi:hypothetical protein